MEPHPAAAGHSRAGPIIAHFDLTLSELRQYRPPRTEPKGLSTSFWAGTIEEARRAALQGMTHWPRAQGTAASPSTSTSLRRWPRHAVRLAPVGVDGVRPLGHGPAQLGQRLPGAPPGQGRHRLVRPLRDPPVASRTLYADGLVLVARPDHPFDGRGRIDVGRLAEARLILVDRTSASSYGLTNCMRPR
jgi:hypothetical protein